MWLSIVVPILLSVLAIVCVLLTLVVLMQRPKNEGLGAAFGSGVTENIFGAQTATVLTKATVYLGCIFFGLTLLLTVLTARQSRRVGVLESEVSKAAALPTPKMITSPAAAGSPQASASVAASASPGTSATPLSSATPGASATPATSATPLSSATPGASATPATSATPLSTATPGVSASPSPGGTTAASPSAAPSVQQASPLRSAPQR
jgi:preprotein translocase subunit SecG